ncbi:MAG: Ig-like domain-containing protein [Bacteriodetes bacterium]|nr:Ig-like domain-containing protein [Bacteroidota bacterium]
MKKIIVIVLLIIGLTGCYIDNPNTTDVKNIINMSFSKDTILANGKDTTRITVSLEDISIPDGQTVAITTTTGSFIALPGNATLNSSTSVSLKTSTRKANILFVASNEDKEPVITASVGIYSIYRIISYRKSNPTSLILNADKLIADANGTDKIQFTINTTNDSVLVTEKRKVFLNYMQASNDSVLTGMQQFGYTNLQGNISMSLQSIKADTLFVQATFDQVKSNILRVRFK